MRIRIPFRVCLAVLFGIALASLTAQAQVDQPPSSAELRVHIDFDSRRVKDHPPAAVAWLKALPAVIIGPTLPPERFTLLQKNRMFTPHVLVVPVGSVVAFPNADPFFHNVFSLFNGKRFDLGFYEAGKSKDVVFSREGVSYIFCNIHPDMSAVVLALSTPYFAIADHDENLRFSGIPAGDYEMRVWIEGLTQSDLDRMVRRVHLGSGKPEMITLQSHDISNEKSNHLNKFGQPYEAAPKPAY